MAAAAPEISQLSSGGRARGWAGAGAGAAASARTADAVPVTRIPLGGVLSVDSLRRRTPLDGVSSAWIGGSESKFFSSSVMCAPEISLRSGTFYRFDAFLSPFLRIANHFLIEPCYDSRSGLEETLDELQGRRKRLTMPLYEYQCKDCGVRFERTQSFSDAPLTRCPECDGRVHRVIGVTGVIFKGSGFYVTDNRSGSDGRRSTSKASGDKTEKDKSAEGESKPAEAKATSASTETTPSASSTS
jgi:putative FmdB family regulatory protein